MGFSFDPIIGRLISGGSRVADDAQQTMDTLAADQRNDFRDAVRVAINQRASNDAGKARKIFYSLGDTGRYIFGDTYPQVKKDFDRASKAVSK